MAYKDDTKFVQIGNRKEEPQRSVNTPIYFTTAYRHEDIGMPDGYDYIRTGNPTRDVLEDGIALLENGTRGFACRSGMSAMQLTFALIKKSDDFISLRDVYGGSLRIFEMYVEKYGISFSYWDKDYYEEIEKLIHPSTKALFIETP